MPSRFSSWRGWPLPWGRGSLQAAAVLSCACAIAGADTFDFTVDAGASALGVTANNSIDISGTWIGNYDPVNNPGGTQTRPGAFGGSGNHPIPFAATFGIAGSGQTSPGGSFTAAFDFGAGSASVSGLALDLLNSGALEFPLTVALSFNTFHTVNPNAIFFGGNFPPIEVGEVSVTALAAQQTGASGGVVEPAGPGMYNVVLIVPAAITVEMTVLGQAFAPDPVPAVFAFGGTLTVAEDGGTATLALSANVHVEQAFEPEGVTFEDVPFDLPTILPPGSYAHLLMSGTVDKIGLDMTFDIALAASGVASCVPDFNGDGLLNLFDFLAFANAFNDQDPAADLNGNGAFELFDFLLFVNLFNQGC